MKLNGAFEPQQGASLIGSSIGAKKYRDKRCDNESNNNVALNCVCALGKNTNCNSCNYNFEDWIEAPQANKLQQPKPANIKPLNIVVNCDIATRQAAKHVSKIITTSESNHNDNNKTNYNKNKKLNARTNTNDQSIIKSTTTTRNLLTMDVLLHTIAMLLSFSNYNVRIYCTTWLRSCNIKILKRVPPTLWSSSKKMPTPATTTTTLANIRLNAMGSRPFGILNSKMALVMCLCSAFILLPCRVLCDESNTLLPANSIEVETTTPEFDYASRGQKKFGDKCDNTLECGFPGSICDPKKKSCQCTEDLPVTNHFDKCGKEATINESCFFNEQCEVKYFQTECRDNRCVCRFEMTPIWAKDGTVECSGRGDKRGNETYIDPAMIGVLLGMALMFVIICVVLRLFSQARWRENRTIFNTPNPRLMNVSLLRESKLLHGQERRGSRMSVRAPSRQPSMASLRPHSPNPSLGKTGSGSNSHGSNASATSLRSTRSNSVAPGNIGNGQHERQQNSASQLQATAAITNITTNPVAENITVEIIEVVK